MRSETRRNVVLTVLWATVMGFLLATGTDCLAAQDPIIRVVVARGKVTVTGVGSAQVIDRVGDVQPGAWVEPAAGSVTYLVRESGVELLPAGVRTRVSAAPSNWATTSEKRGLVDLVVALFLPQERWSSPAITKGDEEEKAAQYRVLYPRDTKVEDREPVFAWAGGGDRFEVRLYRSGSDEWVWKKEIRGERRATLIGQPLEDGQAYTWEVRDIQNPENVAVAVFATPSRAERQRLAEAIRSVRESCRVTSPSFTCDFAVAGLYRKEGYVYNAIRVLEAVRSGGRHAASVESLLRELED